MRIRIDKENDVLYFRIDEKQIVESEELQPGVILDYDDQNRIVGIEILGISKRIPPEELNSIHFQAA